MKELMFMVRDLFGSEWSSTILYLGPSLFMEIIFLEILLLFQVCVHVGLTSFAYVSMISVCGSWGLLYLSTIKVRLIKTVYILEEQQFYLVGEYFMWTICICLVFRLTSGVFIFTSIILLSS